MYPFLQSGHVFWFTVIETGPEFVFDIDIKKRKYKITFRNSLFGWTSRPSPGTETHFYSLNLLDIFGDSNSGFKFGSLNLFNHTNVEIETRSSLGKNLYLAYEFEYFDYFFNPEISYIVHSLNFRWPF